MNKPLSKETLKNLEDYRQLLMKSGEYLAEEVDEMVEEKRKEAEYFNNL